MLFLRLILIASPVSFLCEVVDVKDTYSKRIVTVKVFSLFLRTPP